MRVVGLGQCSFDIIAFADGYPAEDTKKEVFGLVTCGGGPVATALVALARLGVKTDFMGVISDDPAGYEIRKGLKEEGVGISRLLTKRGGRSQTAFILVNKGDGSRTIFWQRPTVGDYHPGRVDRKAIEASDLLLLDGIMKGASVRAARAARGAGVPVMLDAGRMRPGVEALLPLTDYIVGSEEFAKGLGKTPKDAIRALIPFNPKAVTITLGRRGSLTWVNGPEGARLLKTPAFKVDAVDTTGAGDVFHAGYAYGVLKRWPMEKITRFASAFAALKCLEPGGRNGIPSLNATLRFMNRKAT